MLPQTCFTQQARMNKKEIEQLKAQHKQELQDMHLEHQRQLAEERRAAQVDAMAQRKKLAKLERDFQDFKKLNNDYLRRFGHD